MRILAVASSFALVLLTYACGSEKKEAEDATSYTFTTDVQPILRNSCGMGNGTCHDTANGDTGINYVGEKSLFIAVAADVKSRVDSSDEALQMPKPGYGKTLSDDDKAKIIAYLNQSTQN